ncbi:MAG: hypothetical protein CMF39_03690 [Legionellaceae bacterium]|nr:hypothetical protein [Legionellaceae bacterium]
MQTAKVMISLPKELNSRFQAAVPSRQRSAVIRELLEKEIEKREKKLYDCALAVEADEKLNREMKDWDVTLNDGLDDETW